MKRIGHTVGETGAFQKFAKANLNDADKQSLRRIASAIKRAVRKGK